MTGRRASSRRTDGAHGSRAARPPRRLRRERRTVEVMIGMYCRAHHDSDRRSVDPGGLGRSETVTTLGGTRLCPGCAALLEYAGRRIDACRFGEQKPTCARCTVHCFRTDERERTKAVMRYSGPRMMLRHPYLAVRHLLDRHHTPAT